MKIIFDNLSKKSVYNKIQYVWDIFYEYLNIDDTESDKIIRIAYSDFPDRKDEYDIIIYSSSNSVEYYCKREEYKVDMVRYYEYNEENIPFLFYSEESKSLFKVQTSPLKIEIFGDIFLSAFFFLSLWQEFVSEKRDRHNRYSGIDSIQNKLNILKIPVVNQYFDFLSDLLKVHFKFREEKKIFNGKSFAIGISHDIDYIRKWTLGIIYREIFKLFLLNKNNNTFQHRFKRLFHFIKSFSKNFDPYKISIEKIMNFEKRNKIHSTFFFKTGGRTKHDISYSIKSQYVKNLIRRLILNKFDIGLHPSYNAYNDVKMMAEEKYKLVEMGINKEIGVRDHFLRFDIHSTSRIQNELGFVYDSTLGFHDFEGFRSSYCLPYRIYDIELDKPLDIWEIPLVMMDATLNDYRHMSKSESIETIKSLIKTIKYYKGVGVLLFHNTCYDDFDFQGWGNVFEKCILYAIEENAFIGSLKEIKDYIDS
jgi:hypothetical protein